MLNPGPIPFIGQAKAGSDWRVAGLRRFLKFPRSLSVTREGKVFIGVLLVIGLAAVNTGNNLLYLVVSSMLSIIIVSGLMSESTLRGLRVTRALPRSAYKGSPACITIRVENTKRLFSSYSFKIKGTDGPSAPAYVVRLKPGEKSELRLECLFTKRGYARPGPVRVSTRFPFGLFVKGKSEPGGEDESVLVLPSTDRALAIKALQGASSITGDGRSSQRGAGVDLHGLREYGPADDARHIHWKSAARKEPLLLKEFEREAGKRVMIIFDNRRGATDDEFETLVDRAAATAAFHIEAGGAVGLKTVGRDIPPKPGRAQLSMILKELALISPAPVEGEPALRVASA
ncbi:MAG: DUF58 domain-containing protein [Deltaproteobacteria bacterium]|nr:DUF58 domain-containing protein [Deltaproteobacteria bacterium]MCL4872638.1 DUF58 domain-containing protein [bacterium]